MSHPWPPAPGPIACHHCGQLCGGTCLELTGSQQMTTGDPAYFLLMDGHTSTPIEGLYRESCYICRDPEFAMMGLPLCYRCFKCSGHVPADDTICTDCGTDQHEEEVPDGEGADLAR